MSDLEIVQQRADAFYDRFERKADLQRQTHYCPGCGHGIIHKLIARAIDQLGVKDRTVLVSPVGCSVFAYYYFDVGNVQAAHGRAPAVATAVKRSLPGSVVIGYQGDGDLAAIGAAEILHAANRGEPITVIFVNNAIYGMTGGQIAPTTPIGEKTITSPAGRTVWNEGYPLHVAEVLSSLEAPVYVERVALGSNAMIMSAGKAIKKAITNQVNGSGFSFVEILSPCPTIWKMQPPDAQTWVRDNLTKVFPLGVFRDNTAKAGQRPVPVPAPPLEDIPTILGTRPNARTGEPVREDVWPTDFRIKIAGFGGQGVLLLGEVLAEAGLDAGLHVSWLPSYGPEMRSGTSHCHVRLSTSLVDSPLVARPNLLIAMNEPSLRKFIGTVQAGGHVIYNGPALPDGLVPENVSVIAQPFSALADGLGDTRVTNMVMLGALLEATGLLEEEWIDGALRRHVKSERWLKLDLEAIACGRQAARSAVFDSEGVLA